METIKAPKNVVVKRSKWLKGDVEESVLLNEKGKMCCLGFLAREAGFTPKQIRKVCQPDDLNKQIIGLTKPIGFDQLWGTRTCFALMSANDSGILTDQAREKKIKSLGKKIGVTFKFVD